MMGVSSYFLFWGRFLSKELLNTLMFWSDYDCCFSGVCLDIFVEKVKLLLGLEEIFEIVAKFYNLTYFYL